MDMLKTSIIEMKQENSLTGLCQMKETKYTNKKWNVDILKNEKYQMTKEEMRRLRKASEGRAYLTKQLYDTIQKVFGWLNEVTPVGLEIEFSEKYSVNGAKMKNHTVEKKLDPISYSPHWLYDGIDILMPYENWQNKMLSNPLQSYLSREQIMTIAMHIDVIIGTIRLQLSDDTKELQQALDYVQEVLQKEVKE